MRIIEMANGVFMKNGVVFDINKPKNTKVLEKDQKNVSNMAKKVSKINTSSKINLGWRIWKVCYNVYMFRLIILIAIFFAVYPMIGNGYDQFMSDFNINGVGEVVSNIVTGFTNLIDNFKS